MFKFRRREIPWEVVDSKAVEAVPMYYEDDGMCKNPLVSSCSDRHFIELDIAVVGESDTRGTYVFEVDHGKKHLDLKDAVVFARQQLLQEVIKKGYNILLLERWIGSITPRTIVINTYSVIVGN